jgi:hypothetical protein
MKFIGISAIVVLLLVACVNEYIKSGEQRKAMFAAVDAQLRASDYHVAPASVGIELRASTRKLAESLTEVAATCSLLNESAAQGYRKERELLYRSHGAEFQMSHELGSCTIEVRLPGVYTIHARARQGHGFFSIEWESVVSGYKSNSLNWLGSVGSGIG